MSARAGRRRPGRACPSGVDAGVGAALALAAAATIAACDASVTEHLAPVASAARVSSGTDDAPRFTDWAAPLNLGPVVNTAVADFDPFVSRDGLSLYFAAGPGRGGEGGRDLWVAERASLGAPWGEPVNLGSVINTGAHESKPTLYVDGHHLYFASNRLTDGLGGFDLYVSRRRNRADNLGWETPVNLGPGVNSAANEESPAAMFEDEATGITVLYFASDRGSPGVFSIYASTREDDGAFGPVVRVDELSSATNDRDPSVRRDGRELYLASNRPGSQGMHDLWVATRASTADPWSTPLNVGVLLNGPTAPDAFNNMGPALSFDGTTLHFASAFRPDNVGGPMYDIWVSTRTRVRGR